jgi:dTDP-4-amino-4,6-dideoxygalactose transaminase
LSRPVERLQNALSSNFFANTEMYDERSIPTNETIGGVDAKEFTKDFLEKLLSDLPVVLPWQHQDSYSSMHLYVIRLKLNEIDKSHREVFELLVAAGIGVNVHYIPVHTQPFYRDLGFKFGDFPEAERYYSEAVSLPIFQSLKDEQQDIVVNVLRKILIG